MENEEKMKAARAAAWWAVWRLAWAAQQEAERGAREGAAKVAEDELVAKEAAGMTRTAMTFAARLVRCAAIFSSIVWRDLGGPVPDGCGRPRIGIVEAAQAAWILSERRNGGRYGV